MTSNQKTQILCVLFSDLKGYSSLRDDQLKNKIVQEMGAITERYIQPGVQVIKKMGDGLMIGSFTPLPLAELALRLRDAFRTTDWKAQGFLDDFLIRIGLHADEMIVHYRDDGTIEDVIGTAVDTTARIEPVTEPNAVFCSGYFYTLLQQRGVGKIIGFSQGPQVLAKQYGEMELYELRWSHELEVKEVSVPRASSIPMPTIKRPFTDKDRKDFYLYAFKIIKSYFDEATKQLQKNMPEVEATVTTIGDIKFTCEIYINGKFRSHCKIWIGSMMGARHECISYSESYRSTDDDSSSNDMVMIVEEAQKMLLRSSLGATTFLRRGPNPTKPSTPEQIAEYLWLRVTRVLEF